MTTLLTSLLLMPVLTSPIDAGAGVELRYRGTLTETGRDSNGAIVKRFNFYCLVSNADDGGRQLAFVINERGGGEWPWPERYGMIRLDSANRPANAAQIRLLYSHQEQPSSIRLRRPIFGDLDKLKAQANWTDGNRKYAVTGSTSALEMDCWRVVATSNFGLRENLIIEKQSGLIVSSERELTRGQGVPFSLKFDLESHQPVDETRLEQLQKPINTLLKLQADLKRPENSMKPELTKEQLELANTVEEQLQAEADETPFARLAATVRRDVKRQGRRYDDVVKLASKYLGRPAPQFSLSTTDRKEITPETMAGNVIVLHFWDYKFEPLVEPYGQAAYLDFSYNRYKKLGVQVYGVAVNSHFNEDSTSAAAKRSVRKFYDFMKISYPVAYDAGELIGKFGDPRRVGAQLPLWVVIDSEGNISHYKTGFYDINPDEGLRTLDRAVGKAVRAKRNAKEETFEK